MMTHCKVACIQMTSGPDIAENLKAAAVLINDAAKGGAELVITPENTDAICIKDKILETAQPSDKHPGIKYFSVLAKELGIWILIGSMKIKTSDNKVANRSFLFSNKGQLMATYDKIHMFDVDLPNGEVYRESENFEPGNKAVLAGIEGRKFGLSICYDVRFPHLYRTLAQNGAEMIAVPSAFAVPTGKDHWETLLRARAIETGCFVFAPAQVGEHDGGRKTYGHSMIVNPWGKVVAEMTEDKPGFIMHEAKFIDVAKARSAVPSLTGDRKFELLSTTKNIT
jgi:predicted amidohydrolase